MCVSDGVVVIVLKKSLQAGDCVMKMNAMRVIAWSQMTGKRRQQQHRGHRTNNYCNALSTILTRSCTKVLKLHLPPKSSSGSRNNSNNKKRRFLSPIICELRDISSQVSINRTDDIKI